MFLYAEQILLDLTNCQDDCNHPKQTLLLTSQLVDLINLSEYHQSNPEVLLDRLLSPSAIGKLINLLKSANDTEVLDNVITVFSFICEFRKGASYKIDLSETELWKILFSLAVNPPEFIPRETYHSILETVANYFKNKLHIAAACESLENSKTLARHLTELLFYKNEKQKNETNKKTAQKRRKAAASILSSVSRHKSGPELIKDAGLVERLHSYVLQISTDEKSDVIIHKIGQTILRCIPLRNLPGLTDTRSAYVYRSFGRSPGALEGELFDSSEESGEEDDESEESSCDENDELVGSHTSFQYSPEELDQYRRIIDDDRPVDSKDELKKLFESASLGWSRNQVYEILAQSTKSTHGFTLAPCPDWANASGNVESEKLYAKDRRVCRDKLLKTLSLARNPDAYKPELVYDLDSCLLSPEANRTLKMIDVESVSRGSASHGKSLVFESRFESGNLRKAYQVGEREYDLILNADVNSTGRQQWFYFRVTGGIRSSASYTFNILNFEKQRNLFNQGMKPVVFSVKEYSKTGQAIWKRSGSEICYYRNVYRRNANQSYWTLSFDVTFPFDNDVVYIAYHYPYTYTQLLTDIAFWQREYQSGSRSHLRISSLCNSPCGNPVPVMWIRRSQELRKASVSFVSARVHPGESCASWCLRGFVNATLNDKQSTHSHRLRKSPSLCVVPMLNVDGTVHGCARTEVTNEDLNRKWLKPEKRHPSIYHAKGLIEFIRRETGAKPLVLCDMHGHSRRFNAFVYGCQSTPDNNQIGTRLMSSEIHGQPSEDGEEDTDHNLPVFVQTLKSKVPDCLDIAQCSWKMEESRESTARIVGWRHLGFANSYTLECSMAGFQLKPEDEWIHFNTAKYKEIGSGVYKTIQQMSELS